MNRFLAIQSSGRCAFAAFAIAVVWLFAECAANAADPKTPRSETRLSPSMATGKETVHFSTDIAPVLVANCLKCHTSNQTGGQLRMDTFPQLLRGGQNGAPWKPGDPGNSFIIKKLKGLAGARMPLKKPPLADDVIAKIETWIAEGGTFDGPKITQPLAVIAATVRAKSESHEALSAERRESAERKWRTAVPDEKPVTKETKNFFLISNISEASLDEVAEAAEAQAAALAKLVRAPADRPLVKGRMTLFLFPARYDYSEFGQMVEQRQLPVDWRGHWKFDFIDAYGAVVIPPSGADYSLAGIIAEQLGAVYAASLTGESPAWFCEGFGREMAARADGGAPRVHRWNERLKELLAGKNIEGFLDHKLAPADNDVAAYGFVKALLASSNKFESLLVALRGGEEFEPAFTRIFGPPKKGAATWARTVKPL